MIVDKMKYYTVVNGVFHSFLCEITCFNLRNDGSDVINARCHSLQPNL